MPVENVLEISCKIDGCPNPAAKQKGPYGRLCAEHAAERKANSKPPAEIITVDSQPTTADPVLQFQAAADQVVDAHFELAAARAKFDQAVAELQTMLHDGIGAP